MTIRASWRYLFIALLSAGLGACGGAQMTKADQAPAIKQGEAIMVVSEAADFKRQQAQPVAA